MKKLNIYAIYDENKYRENFILNIITINLLLLPFLSELTLGKTNVIPHLYKLNVIKPSKRLSWKVKLYSWENKTITFLDSATQSKYSEEIYCKITYLQVPVNTRWYFVQSTLIYCGVRNMFSALLSREKLTTTDH